MCYQLVCVSVCGQSEQIVGGDARNPRDALRGNQTGDGQQGGGEGERDGVCFAGPAVNTLEVNKEGLGFRGRARERSFVPRRLQLLIYWCVLR